MAALRTVRSVCLQLFPTFFGSGTPTLASKNIPHSLVLNGMKIFPELIEHKTEKAMDIVLHFRALITTQWGKLVEMMHLTPH